MTTGHTWNEIASTLRARDALVIPAKLRAIACGAPEAAIPLRELGVPFWPRLRCEIDGKNARIEMRGDARVLGVERILEVEVDDRR